MYISFNFLSPISLLHRAKLKLFILALFKKERKKVATLSFIFCSDAFLLEMNRTYLQHDYFTDIITFDLSGPGSKSIQGEVYISTDTVRSNASRFGTSIKKELHRVIFHGVLHLCGYADKTSAEKRTMTLKENYYLDKYFNVPRGA